MKEELTKKLIEWVERLGDIATEQLPDFAQQIVAYQMWSASIGLYIGIFLLVIMIILAAIMFIGGSQEKNYSDKCDSYYFGSIILLISIVPLLWIGCEYCIIKKCEVAPKLVIIDYIRK